MPLELDYPHVEKPVGKAARLKRLPRVHIAQIVMDYIAHGWSPDEMCRQHPYLQPAEAHAAMAYHFDHQDEIESEIHAEWAKVQQDRTLSTRSPFFLRMHAKGLL